MTPEQKIAAFMSMAMATTQKHVKEALQNLGEKCVKAAREDHPNNWKDQTGNLRSSIGYAIYKGNIADSDSAFPAVNGKDGKPGIEGSEAGKNYVREIAKECSSLYTLAVVAGMDYAAAVEEKRDVLAGAEIIAKTKMADYMKKAHKRAAREINHRT